MFPLCCSSNTVTEALEGLRQNLRERGIQVGLVPLQTLLLHSAAS